MVEHETSVGIADFDRPGLSIGPHRVTGTGSGVRPMLRGSEVAGGDGERQGNGAVSEVVQRLSKRGFQGFLFIGGEKCVACDPKLFWGIRHARIVLGHDAESPRIRDSLKRFIPCIYVQENRAKNRSEPPLDTRKSVTTFRSAFASTHLNRVLTTGDWKERTALSDSTLSQPGTARRKA